MMKRKPGQHGNFVLAYVCTIQTASFDETVVPVKANGGENVTPTMPIPGVGWLTYCTDTEGNILGVMQKDPTAK